MDNKSVHPGALHLIRPSIPFHQPLVAFEHSRFRVQPPNPSPPRSTLIFLGGMCDSLLSVHFVPSIVSALPASWSLVEPILPCSANQAGFSSLAENITEIAEVVTYFRNRNPSGNIVLFGHSTGSLQTMRYLLAEPKLPHVDGAVMQSAVSDREGLLQFVDPKDYDSTCKLAKDYVRDGRGNDILPSKATNTMFPSAPLSAQRFLDLASPGPEHAGADDLFSSDLDESRLEATFGKLGQSGSRIAILFGSRDQYVPASVDRVRMVENWHQHVKRGGGVVDEASGVIEGASHTLVEGGKPLEDLVERTLGFLGRLDKSA